jgi:hypothetical protein
MDGVHQIISKSVISLEISFLLVGVNQLEFELLKSVDLVCVCCSFKSIERKYLCLALSRTSNKQNGNIRHSSTIIDEKKTSPIKKFDIPVTVYWNYDGDNGGILLNPQRFHSSMLSIFGPNECNSVLKTIFDCCIKCSFQPKSFINRIRDLFTLSNETKRNSLIQIECNSQIISF